MKSLPQIIQSLAFSLVLCMMSMGAEFSGKVVKIVDGDTMDIMRDGAPVRVRLDGIDAPEKAQAWAEKSRKGLEAMIAGKIVSCTYKKSDRYKRILGRIKVQGVDVNRAMIKQGLAWHFVKYNKELELANDVGGSFHATYKITASTGEGVEAKNLVLAFTQEQWRAMALRMLEMTGYVEHLKERCLAQNDEEQDAW